MLKVVNESHNFSANSEIEGNVVLYMSASVTGLNINFSQNIQNLELYVANKETVDADYADFQEYVLNKIVPPNAETQEN